MTETSRGPRKRAPRKAAPATEAPTGVTASRAAVAREQLEAATGEEVTAAAARKLRGGHTEYVVTPARAERLAHAGIALPDQHPDDPGPAEPVDLVEDEAPAAGVDVVQTVGAGAETRTARETAPRADAGANPADGLDVAGPDRGEAADVEAAQQTDGDPGAERTATLEALADEELPGPAGEGGTPAGPGTPPAAVVLESPDGERGVLIGPADKLTDLVRPEAVVDDDLGLELLGLVANLDDVGLDPRLLVAGRVETAPDGRRVTVLAGARGLAFGAGETSAQAIAAAATAPQLPVAAPGVDVGEGAPPLAADTGEVPPVRLSAALAAAIEEARDLEVRAAELKEAAEAIKSQVREAMGGDATLATEAIAPDGTKLATWSRYVETRLDSKALKRAHPDVWAAFASTNPKRRFTWAE